MISTQLPIVEHKARMRSVRVVNSDSIRAQLAQSLLAAASGGECTLS